MFLSREYYYNPFFTDVNNKRYEINNILFFDRSGVVCQTGKGWFTMDGRSNNNFHKGLELPTTCILKRAADFSLNSAFIIKSNSAGTILFGIPYDLYIPAAVVGLKAPTVRRPNWDKRHFEITYKSNIEGVGVVAWHFVDAPLCPLEEQLHKIAESLSRIYNTSPEALAAVIKELNTLKKQYTKEYEKMLAITPEEILQQARRAEY